MKKILAAVLLLCASVCAYGQGATLLFPSAVNSQGGFLSFATVTFCTTPASISPITGSCTNTVTVFKDQALTQPYSSAIQTDGIGYFPPNAITATSLWFSPAANLCYTLTTSNILSPATNPCVPFSVGVQLNSGSLSFPGNLTQTQPTNAGVAANQSSFFDCMNASYWTGAISATDQWCLQDVLGTGANPTSTFTLTHGGSPGSSGLATFAVPALSAQSVSTCVPTDATGATSMSSQIQACISAAVTNKTSKIVIPCGTYLLSTAIDMTNKPGLLVEGCAAQYQLSNQGSVASVGQTLFLCNTGGVCWDFTGSGDGGMRNFRLHLAGTGITNPSPIGILRGRDNNGGGGGGNPFCFSEKQKFENFSILDFTGGGPNTTANGGRGYIGIYNDGAESGKLENFGIFTATQLVYTDSNVASVASPFQTLGTGCTVTMTGEELDTGTIGSNSTITQPNIEADGTGNMEVHNVTFIGGSCGIKFEGDSAQKWHVVANAETENATASFVCSSINLDDSFFHVQPGTITAFINPLANSLTFTNNTFFFNTPAAKSSPLITNTATGTVIKGGYASYNTDTTATNTTLTGVTIIAPTRTTATLQTSFNSASEFYFVGSNGSGHIGPLRADTIRQMNSSTNFLIQDSSGNNHVFITNGTNTFISGNGAGASVLGSGSNTLSVSDTTGRINTYGGISSFDQGVMPIQGAPQHLTGQTAALGATNLFAAPAVGTYRVCFGAFTTTSGSGTTATVSINWTDAGGAKTFTSATWALNSVTITGQVDGCKVIHVASGAIQVSVAGTFGTSAYALDAWAEREN